jgi:hypothetical protein
LGERDGYPRYLTNTRTSVGVGGNSSKED